MIRIFLQDRDMTLVRDVPATPPEPGVLMVHSDSLGTTWSAWESFRANRQLRHLLVIHPNPISHVEELKTKFRTISAGGGIVSNAREEILMIFRKGKWDLPKGKLEEGESPDTGAAREVMEECGIPRPKVEGFFMRTYHVYEDHGESVLKETWWFNMNVPGSPGLIPQGEEGITEARWLDEAKVNEIIPLCYSAVGSLLKTWISRQ